MGRSSRAILAGFLGGLFAGLTDGLTAWGAAETIMGFPSCVHLLVIAAGCGAIAGAALAVVYIGGSLSLDRLLGRSRWASGGHAMALLLAAPLIVYDAFALFHGPKAARIPAHHLLSVLIILLGAAGIWAAATLLTDWLARAERLEGEGGSTAGIRGALLGTGIFLVFVVLAVGRANRNVLPRLYPWFHLTLTLAELILSILAVRLMLASGRQLLGKRWAWRIVAVGVVVLATGVALERVNLSHSQSLRYFVAEKTHLTRLFSGIFTSRARAVARTITSPTGERLPPLPEGPRLRDADVVLITIDALRADHLGCYGYGRPISPRLDALAARSVRFARAYTQAPHTSFALASLMIGKYYPTLTRLAPSDTHETLATILRRYGWKTAAFFPPAVFYVDARKMKAFEANNFDFEYVKYEYLDAAARVGQIEEFLRQENPRKLFLWLHLFEPHEPYKLHPEFDLGERDLDRYDSEIAYSDKIVGRVIDLIRAKRPGAIIIVSADHGEEFGEHGGRYHGTTLYEEQVHVPLIVSAPGLVPHVVSAPVQVIDIPTTILGLLDITLPVRMRGTDLGPWLLAKPAPESRLPPAFAELDDKRMVALGEEKLICSIGKDYCSYFDLATDPGEKRNLADQRAARVTALRQRLDEWLARQSRYEARLLGAADTASKLGRTVERARLGDPNAALPLAQALLGTEALAARREAAALLVIALPPRPETKDALLAAYHRSDDPEIRAWAAVAALGLGATEVQEAVRSLVAEPARQARANLQIYAAIALARRADAAGFDVLVSALGSCSMELLRCRRVIAALGKLRDPRGVAPLTEHLAYVLTRSDTVKAVGEIGDAAAVGTLLGCLEDDAYVSVRKAAATELGRIGGARAVQGLRAALEHEREDAVLKAVRAALARNGKRG